MIIKIIIIIIRLSLSTEEGLTLKLLVPLKINLLKLKLLCEDIMLSV